MSEGPRVAIVHYHLRGGGVSRVIGITAKLLAEREVRFVVLTGEPATFDFPTRTVEGLGYGHDTDPDVLAGRMREAARDALGADPDVWHVHNHSLGKNASLPPALIHLARSGARLLLQIHDFAEDGRRENYRILQKKSVHSVLYPCGAAIHYVTLNRRDQSILQKAGIPEERVQCLPNPLDPAIRPLPSADTGEPPLFLWPSRPIRRKNMGELMLWALSSRDTARFATCLPAADVQSRAIMNHWRSWCDREHLPVSWEVCDGSPENFNQWCTRATAVLTTSMAEGFGLSFIEPWAQARPVVGRNLPEITSDFAGLNLSHLLPALRIPHALVNTHLLRKKIDAAFASHDAGQIFESFMHPDGVDFGRLDEELQTGVLDGLASGSDCARTVLPQMPPLPEAGIIDSNAHAVRRLFSADKFIIDLLGLYGRVAEATPGPVDVCDAGKVHAAFQEPDRMRLLLF